MTFDDAGLVDDAAQVTDFDLAPVSGWLRLGSLEWLFDAGRISTYTFMSGPGNAVVSYGLQLTGTGPTISAGRLRLSGAERHVLQLRRSLRNFG